MTKVTFSGLCVFKRIEDLYINKLKKCQLHLVSIFEILLLSSIKKPVLYQIAVEIEYTRQCMIIPTYRFDEVQSVLLILYY